MAKSKKVRRCGLCGEVLKNPLRYRPDDLNGRYLLACRECVEEASMGKFGEGRRRYLPKSNVSYFKGKRVHNG